jgi:hypothetical protein
VFTTVVFVIVSSSRVTAFQAPSTLNRCRPDTALTKIRVSDHRATQERPEHEVGRVHEEYVPSSGNGLVESGLQLVLQEALLLPDVIG